MGYQVLARKWRPHRFDEMVGQAHVLRALGNGLANGRLHHAYLFTGTRGVGKTTVARILAKCLNCESKGITDIPCGTCAACTEIDEGRFVDLIEVDAASRTKVEDTRELLDNVQYAPTRGRFKIYLIDEVHMLSTHSFNALLKTLEEPPEHVKFLLATTDPQRLPVTVLSRCLQFNLKPLMPDMIGGQLEKISAAEGFAAEKPAIERLARAADGSMRDALSLTDQALAFGGGQLVDSEVRDMLGSIDHDFVLDLLERLSEGDGPGLLDTVGRMAETSPDFAEALAELLATLHQLSLAQTVPAVFDAQTAEGARLADLAERLDAAWVQLLYQIVLQGRRDLPLAPDPRAGFEMILLRMLAFEPDSGNGNPRTTTPSRPSASDSQPPPPPTAASQAAPAQAEPTATTPAGNEDWHRLAAALSLSGMGQALADHCDWVARDGKRVTLQIDEGHRHLVNDNVTARLSEALSEHFGEALSVDIRVGRVSAETPAGAAQRVASDRQARARETIETDPNIAALKATFGAEVINESIRPRDRE
ncbi:DNA polymerase III subunit gamma/tau [Spiribacter vilamensis]|uniref:DNA polymerase III subunit gamma/tau n=1 Tax=Spiribacter vilamensis TaxID=531306 RepID=A0A4Q8CYU4_9GAMM|nr:DNA polymerase III subunit gamma/tau [Spiribacter vilamensis]RZU98159.1 DNA polymerase-3 subunit gamma/tau [Spiribacter vilamensis]TVO60940.1 DNA polymerase III subunit gamma/tau [Spiribacter vilamensis]